MNEHFDRDGHLTEAALAALMDGQLDELQRLEVGEHLSFCADCLERYAQQLTVDTLEFPETDVTPVVMQRIRRNKWRASIRRYTAAAVAVAIGSSLWYSGFLNALGDTMLQPSLPLPVSPSNTAAAEDSPSFGASLQAAVDQWSIKVQSTAADAFRSPDSRTTHPQQNQMEDLS